MVWYERKWLILLLLLVCFPLGFYALWSSQSISRSIKNLVTALAALAAILWYGNFQNNSEMPVNRIFKSWTKR
ncbi:MAG: hypothetical protein ACKOXB_11620 [Flavobacteriales bacterium]